MATDLFEQVYFSDGEGITHGDLNDMQRALEAKIWDQIIHEQIGSVDIASAARDPQFGGQDGANHPVSRCYCLNPGAAYLRQGSSNHKIQLAPGTLLQKIAAQDGADPKLLAYTFVGTEEWTLTNGDATNPRVDLLQMKLEYITDTLELRDFEDATTRAVTTSNTAKRRRVQCTLSVKAGTAGASPTIPEPDAGYVPVGSVMVGNGWTTAGAAPIFGEDTAALNNVVVHDQRMPISIRAYRVDPSQFKLVTDWALNNNNSSVGASSGTNLLYVPCPQVGNGRLVAVGVTHSDAIADLTGITLGKSSGLTSASYATRNTVSNPVTGLVVTDSVEMFFTFEAAHLPSAGPTIVQSATTKIGVPLWTNGRRSPHEKTRLVAANAVPADHLVLRVTNSAQNSVLGPVTFYVAEGI
jgi:hypothetical protein